MSQRNHALARPLVIVATERTGTNYLCALLSQHPQIAAYYEIFSNVAVMMSDAEVETLCKIQSLPFVDRSHPKLIKQFEDNHARIVELIVQRFSAEKKICSFKLFQNHLPPKALNQSIVDYDVIVVTRRIIDTYISFVKAIETDDWLRLDTTQIKPRLHIDDFVAWYCDRYDYYQTCASQYLVTHHKRVEVIEYEEFTCGTNVENLNFVCKKLNAATGIELDAFDSDIELKIRKQDKNQSVKNKISNWPEFEAQLREEGLLEIAFSRFLDPSL
ncbi:hypothetical protein S7335_5585 [Synechococcus sp. PCC 7335]|uniref:sulfotransferase domain-containing protein n=1 Tax=Synechococcus sp. (strain ATCC 29403 / PCC 7335) TaxID=91464 RepID=UPI00017EC026|nr:sulfotransferase domain-containing protein [Synechococcus sp. PCC 7335]EDX87872.1 hypothetical protein S7335_5585 [Synechococcus sp. PCC 7335]